MDALAEFVNGKLAAAGKGKAKASRAALRLRRLPLRVRRPRPHALAPVCGHISASFLSPSPTPLPFLSVASNQGRASEYGVASLRHDGLWSTTLPAQLSLGAADGGEQGDRDHA
jgi:hypothetical protein